MKGSYLVFSSSSELFSLIVHFLPPSGNHVLLIYLKIIIYKKKLSQIIPVQTDFFYEALCRVPTLEHCTALFKMDPCCLTINLSQPMTKFEK